MPKKLGINTKAVEAKARKDTAQKAKEEQAQKQKEDALWRDDDKLVNRKMDRQCERDKKRTELAQKKAQNKAAYEEELSQLAAGKAPSTNKTKVTRSHIQGFISKQAEEKEAPKKEITHLEVAITENVNRLEIEGDEARNIEEAITILSVNDPEVDRHPERRLKAAYAAFEELHLPRLKKENPNLRLSQLKQMLKKDWMKSPENPLNQRNLAYNAKV